MKEEKEGLNAYLLVIVLSLILYFGLGYARPEEPAIIIFPLPIRWHKSYRGRKYMFSSDNLESQLKDLLLKLGLKENSEEDGQKENKEEDKNEEGGEHPDVDGGNGDKGNGENGEKDNTGGKGGDEKKKGVLTPSQIMVILGILSGALEPISIIVDRNQNVQIVLSGTLIEKIESKEDTQPKEGDFLDNVIKALL